MSELTQQVEMHPQRWGDPAARRRPPRSARGLVELAFGIDEHPGRRRRDACRRRRSPDDAARRACAASLGAEHVLTDDETRRLRTRGKSTPDLLRARAGDLSDAPDAVVRPGSHDEVAAVLAWAVEHHVAVVPFGGGTSRDRRPGRPPRRLRRRWSRLDLVRMKRLVAVDHESR